MLCSESAGAPLRLGVAGGGGGGGYYGGSGGAGESTDPFIDDGGGGSGFTPDGTGLETGDGSDDDGEVTISWTPGEGCAPTAVVVEPKFTG